MWFWVSWVRAPHRTPKAGFRAGFFRHPDPLTASWHPGRIQAIPAHGLYFIMNTRCPFGPLWRTDPVGNDSVSAGFCQIICRQRLKTPHFLPKPVLSARFYLISCRQKGKCGDGVSGIAHRKDTKHWLSDIYETASQHILRSRFVTH